MPFSLSIIREFLRRGALMELAPNSGDSGNFLLGLGQGQAESFYSPEFFSQNPSAWIGFEAIAPITRVLLKEWLETYLSESSSEPFWEPSWVEPDRAPFFEELEELRARFRSEELRKVVPVVFVESAGSPGPRDRAKLLLSLLERAGVARIYGKWDESDGILGATPEVLFESRDGVIQTMALAGTAPKSDGRDYLLKSEKDLREHRWVIEDVRERLATDGEVEIGETGVMELPTIYHLHTPIWLRPAAESVGKGLENWAGALHPTAALGGYPRERAWSWLKDSDNRARVKRRRFGAPFGVRLENGESACLVAIRNIQWESERTWLGSGCGIVEGSDPEREWQELSHKRASVRRMLGMDRA